MDSFKIFIDESGTHALDTSKSGVSNLFVLTAIIIKDSDFNFVNSELDKFAQENCSGAELKSSKIAGDSRKRFEWITRFSALPFNFISFIVNKKKLNSNTPLRFKPVFYKWVNRQLITNLSEIFDANVYADATGGAEFQDSFVRYLQKHINSLFHNFNISIVDSKKYRGVQLADIISGSLNYVFDSEKKDDFSGRIWNVLKNKCINIKAWPKIRREDFSLEIPDFLDLDALELKCIEKALFIIERKISSSDELEQMQGIILDELLTAKTSGERESIFGDELVYKLKKMGYDRLANKNFLATGIIAKLRDEGVVIAGNNDGYTLAISPNDFEIFTDHNNGIILPMLERLNTARVAISEYTNKQCDILNSHEQLKKLVDFYVNEKLKVNLDTTPEEITIEKD